MKTSTLLAVLMTIVASVAFAEAPDWEQHGPLQVSKNQHYLQHEDGTPFTWVGDTGWGMIQYLTREEVDRYLDDRKAKGFTVIQTVAHWYPHGGGLKTGPSNAPDAYGFRPFAGGPDTPDTSQPLMVEGGSPEAPNDYWDHADYVIQAIRKRGMYVGLLPIWARAYVTSTFGGTRQEYAVSEAKSFGAFLGARYRNEPHILWILGGDTRAEMNGYDKSQRYAQFDGRPVFRAMAEGIGLGVTGKKLEWNKADKGWDKVFITYHPDGDAPYRSSTWFHKDAWLDANGVEVWRQMEQVYPTMLADYQLADPVKPSLFLEGSYEYGSYRYECGWVTPVKVRRQFYQTFFAGGAGHTYGAGPIWAMRGKDGDYNCGYTWQQALTFPGAAQVATVGRAFIEANGWWRWTPNGLLIEGVGEGESLKSAVIDSSGKAALVYFANRSATRVRNILSVPVSLIWFDPRDGRQEEAGSLKAGEARDMLPPDRWEDAVLLLKDASSAS